MHAAKHGTVPKRPNWRGALQPGYRAHRAAGSAALPQARTLTQARLCSTRLRSSSGMAVAASMSSYARLSASLNSMSTAICSGGDGQAAQLAGGWHQRSGARLRSGSSAATGSNHGALPTCQGCYSWLKLHKRRIRR